jgi:hypothetical protein
MGTGTMNRRYGGSGCGLGTHLHVAQTVPPRKPKYTLPPAAGQWHAPNHFSTAACKADTGDENGAARA